MKTALSWFTQNKYVLLACLLAIVAGIPLLHAGLIPTHDGEYHLIRFYEFNKMLASGSLYPRWAPDLNFGYGIPLFTYVYPLPNYIASIFHAFGASFLDSVKLNMFAATIVGALFFYLWTKRFWGNLGGLVASISYTFAPYHFVDIYVRGSVGEVWALALFPAFSWAFAEFSETRRNRYVIFASVFLALIIFSHNILGLMFFCFALTYIALCVMQSTQKMSLIRNSLLILTSGLGLAAIFWIPALFETKFVTGLQIYTIKQNFADLSQLLFPSWGTDFFGAVNGNTMSVQIGVANLLSVCISMFVFFTLLKKRTALTPLLTFFLLWFFLLVFLILPYSLPVWEHIPLMHYFQFPWRFLSLLILVCAFLSGAVTKIKFGKVLSWVYICITILITIGYTTPAYYMLRNDTYYITRSNFIDGTNSPGNAFNTIWNSAQSSHPKELFVTDTQRLITHVKKYSPTQFQTTIKAQNSYKQIVNVSYFPGWHVYIDAKSVNVFSTHGLLSFIMPKGVHRVKVVLEQTTMQSLAAYITFITILFLSSFFLLRKRIG